MTVYVDTSALYALIDAADERHDAAVEWLAGVVDDPRATIFVTSSAAVVETAALVQRRIGMPALRDLFVRVVPRLYVDHAEHGTFMQVVTQHLAAGQRAVSLVDRIGFDVARRHRCSRVFAFDPHFAAAGFEVVPQAGGR